jgi:3-deoxy-7-phosphoheptulonate synthase
MIDLSHDNSGKDPDRQPDVAGAVAAQIAAGHAEIVGVMLESFLVAGRQDLDAARPLVYGQSITDGCIGWETTVEVLDGLADAVRARRAG